MPELRIQRNATLPLSGQYHDALQQRLLLSGGSATFLGIEHQGQDVKTAGDEDGETQAQALIFAINSQAGTSMDCDILLSRCLAGGEPAQWLIGLLHVIRSMGWPARAPFSCPVEFFMMNRSQVEAKDTNYR